MSIAPVDTRSARARYFHHSRIVQDQIERLQAKLLKHSMDFNNSGGADWGYVGDLAHIAEVLAEAIGEAE